MNLFFLRVVLFLQTALAMVSINYGCGYLSWKDVPLAEIVSSRDATFSIETLHSSWWFFKGICVGMTLCLIVLAIIERKEIIDSTWKVKGHWVALILPMLILFWFGRNISYGA